MSEKVPRPTVDSPREGINEIRYPLEYFEAQIAFAQKWAELSGEPLMEVLVKRTVLARRLDTGLTVDIKAGMLAGGDTLHLAQMYYSRYVSQECARYTPEHSGDHVPHEGYGFFSYDYYPDNPMSGGKNSIKIHFVNKKRGEKSGLAPEFREQRRHDVRNMIADVVRQHPEANEVVGGSWLYNLPAYLDSFPTKFVEILRLLVPAELAEEYPDAVPYMSFRGNSIWGQLIDRHGWVAMDRYDQFMAGIDRASNLKDLYEAIPLKPLQPSAPPSVFLD